MEERERFTIFAAEITLETRKQAMTLKATLIDERNGKAQLTRHDTKDIVTIIRTGLLASGENTDGLPLTVDYDDCLILEINNLPDRKSAEEVRDEARHIPYTLITFVGADGRSVKIVCKAEDRDLWQAPDGYELHEVERLHLNAYAKYHYLYSTQLGIRVENTRPTLHSSCPLSHDPDVYFNPDAMLVEASPYEQTADWRARAAEAGDTNLAAGEGVIPGLSMEASMRLEYQACKADALETCRLDSKDEFTAHCLEVLAFNCHESGLEEAFAVRMTRYDKRFSADMEYLQSVFDSQYSQTLKATWPLKHVKPSQLAAYKTEAFLHSRYELRKNVMTGVAQYRPKDAFARRFRDLTKEVLNTMSIRAQKAGIDSWDKDIRRYVESTLIRQYDPLNEWLEQLPPWDGKDRVTLLAQRLKTKNTLWPDDFRTWMRGMVAHWKGIDCHRSNSIVPLIIGRQSSGKTCFCSLLLPDKLHDYYSDKADFRSDAAIDLGLTSLALIAIDELDLTSKSLQPLLKRLLPKQEVTARPPYGKARERCRRYASLIATTGDIRPLPADRSASRRFLCIQAEGTIDTTTPIDHKQMYAQLLAEIGRGDRYWFDEADMQRIATENRRYERVGSIEGMLSETFQHAAEGKDHRMSVNEIVDTLCQLFPNFHRTKNINAEVGKALNQLGYKPHKTSTCQVYYLEKTVYNA